MIYPGTGFERRGARATGTTRLGSADERLKGYRAAAKKKTCIASGSWGVLARRQYQFLEIPDERQRRPEQTYTASVCDCSVGLPDHKVQSVLLCQTMHAHPHEFHPSDTVLECTVPVLYMPRMARKP